MKKILILPLLALLVTGGFYIYTKTIEETPTETSQSSTGTLTYELQKEVAVTPDETYAYGAFCRVNYLEASDEYLVTFGGSSTIVPVEPGGRAGGAEGGNGYSYKMYDSDFEYTDETGVVANAGGDAASVYADGYYYFLIGDPNGWKILKIDTATREEVDSVVIEMDVQHEARNDQMLAYANGFLIASSLYDAGNVSTEMDQLNTDPNTGYATHNRIFNTDLEQLDYFILDDTPHINASYVVFANGVYNYVTSTALFGDLIVMQYDEDWNYLGVKTIEEHGNWSQGALYDADTERFYVSYVDFGELTADGKLSPGTTTNINLGVFDKDWNLIENIVVTNFVFDDNLRTGRPSVIMNDGKLFVSYDLVTFNETNREENKDWQCIVDVYEVK